MKKTVIGLLSLSLVITSSVPAYGMWARFGSRLTAVRQLKSRVSRFAQSTKPYLYPHPIYFGTGLSIGAAVMYRQDQQTQSKHAQLMQESKERENILKNYIYEEYIYGEKDLTDLNTELITASYLGKTDKVKALLALGLDPETKGCPRGVCCTRKETPLQVASRYGRLDVTKTLLAHGASPNFKPKYTRLPLELARENGHQDVVKELVKAGARTPCRKSNNY